MSKRYEKFTAQHLQQLRTEYSKLKSVPEDRLGELRAIFDNCSDHALKQLARGHIKFVSLIAANACARRNIDVDR